MRRWQLTLGKDLEIFFIKGPRMLADTISLCTLLVLLRDVALMKYGNCIDCNYKNVFKISVIFRLISNNRGTITSSIDFTSHLRFMTGFKTIGFSLEPR